MRMWHIAVVIVLCIDIIEVHYTTNLVSESLAVIKLSSLSRSWQPQLTSSIPNHPTSSRYCLFHVMISSHFLASQCWLYLSHTWCLMLSYILVKLFHWVLEYVFNNKFLCDSVNVPMLSSLFRHLSCINIHWLLYGGYHLSIYLYTYTYKYMCACIIVLP